MKSRLKELRARHGWNQSELARRANISRQTISLIEREEFMPSLLIAVKISRVFETALEDIFYFDEEELM
ncbi:helix-turn-helix transcriptional regulator [Exiguobacterium acetylicum]|uniref:helix-turn-helix transcriptional regulator n=1 Tax=Exiguobacterium acetylicum TaxID=41170 RepID=UPI0039775A4C